MAPASGSQALRRSPLTTSISKRYEWGSGCAGLGRCSRPLGPGSSHGSVPPSWEHTTPLPWFAWFTGSSHLPPGPPLA